MGWRMVPHDIPLSKDGGRKAILNVPSDLSAVEAARLSAVLHALAHGDVYLRYEAPAIPKDEGPHFDYLDTKQCGIAPEPHTKHRWLGEEPDGFNKWFWCEGVRPEREVRFKQCMDKVGHKDHQWQGGNAENPSWFLCEGVEH